MNSGFLWYYGKYRLIVHDRYFTLQLCRKGYNNGKMNYHFAVAMVDGGCDVNMSNLKGVTALMIVAQASDDTELLVSLLEADADMNAVDQNGDTPLHYAERNHSDSTAKEMAEMLFEFGFKNVEAANNDGKTALEIATDANNELLVRLILMNS